MVWRRCGKIDRRSWDTTMPCIKYTRIKYVPATVLERLESREQGKDKMVLSAKNQF